MKKIIIAVVVLVVIVILGVFWIKREMSKPGEPMKRDFIPNITYANVSIKNFSFTPAEIKIKPGEGIDWTNNDNATHRIEIADGTKSYDLPVGGRFTFVFTKAGEYSYICGIHPSMKGKVIVSEK